MKRRAHVRLTTRTAPRRFRNAGSFTAVRPERRRAHITKPPAMLRTGGFALSLNAVFPGRHYGAVELAWEGSSNLRSPMRKGMRPRSDPKII